MVAQVPLLAEPLPNSQEQTSEEFESSVVTTIAGLNPMAVGMNEVANEVNEKALDIEAASEGIANAIWVTGTTYAVGDVRYSPVDFFNYRRKTAGAGSTDPSADSTNWALLTKTSNGGGDTASSAVDVVLTSASGRLQILSMTAPGKKATLPAATTLQKGTSIFVIKNAGLYRFAVHKNGGLFLCYVQPGQVISFSCSDISTAAGVWHVGGQGIEAIYDGATPEVLNAVDSRNIAVAMLSSTKAICVYRNNATGFLWGVILNFGSASGTPGAINGVAASDISIAAQTSTQATVVFKIASGATEGYVLNVSSNTITPGTIAHIDTATGGSGTNVATLSSTKLICFYQNNTTTLAKIRVLDIASSVITPSAEVNGDATTMQSSTRRELGMVSATKALIAYKENGAATIRLRLQSITVSTPAPTGSVLTISDIGGTAGVAFSLVVLSTDRAVLIQAATLTYTDFMFYLIDISGTTPVLLCKKKTRLNIIDAAYLKSTKLDANNIYVTWNGAGSGGVDAVTVKITSGDRILIGNLSERIEPGVTAAEGYVDCVALDSTHVMQVCRNASTFLSAKTVEIAA